MDPGASLGESARTKPTHGGSMHATHTRTYNDIRYTIGHNGGIGPTQIRYHYVSSGTITEGNLKTLLAVHTGGLTWNHP